MHENAPLRFDDGGGESVDLSRCGPEAVPLIGTNLLANGGFERLDAARGAPPSWRPTRHIHTPDPAVRARLEAELLPLMRQGVTNDTPAAGASCLRLSTPAEAQQVRGAAEPLISNGFATTVELPPLASATRFRLRFRYRGSIVAGTPGLNTLTMLVECYDGATPQRETRPLTIERFPPEEAWTSRELIVAAPRETRRLVVSARLYGCGEADLDEIELHRVADEPGFSVRLLPFSFLDNVFCLSPGDPAVLVLAGRNTGGEPLRNPAILLELPAAVSLLDVRRQLKVTERLPLRAANGTAAMRYTIAIDAGTARRFRGDDYETWNAPALLLRADAAAAGDYTGRYWCVAGEVAGAPRPFTLRIIPAVAGARPAHFETGVVMAREGDFTNAAAVAAFADYYTRLGFNAVHMGTSSEMLRALGARGVKRYCQPAWLANGYRIGEAPKPVGVKFRKADGSVFMESGFEALCPVEVYTEGPYYREQVVGAMRRLLVEQRLADSLMPNWEPYMFDDQGCFCARCREEFRARSGLPEAEIDRLWKLPAGVPRGPAWTAFRSWQHGRLMATLERTVAALGREAGIEAHFVPEIAWNALTAGGNVEYEQYNPLDYLADLPVIEPWGPYSFQPFGKPFSRPQGSHLNAWLAARAIPAFVADKIADPARRPKLIAFPHGYQLADWVTTPEAIAMEHLSFFLQGWRGSLVYYFPRGYDARYWNALAGANRLIAACEPFVREGEPLAGLSVEAEPPVPRYGGMARDTESEKLPAALPELAAQPPLVQAVGYRLGEQRLMAIGNFWEGGAVVARLTLADLPEETCYRLRAAESAAGDAGVLVSARALREGVRVSVGALRFAVVIVEPQFM